MDLTSYKILYKRDLIALTKPRITLMATLVALAGVLHASNFNSYLWPKILLSLLGIAFLVSASSSLNMYLERDLDFLMQRTKNRPLPSGRLNPFWALVTSFICLFVSLVFLYYGANHITLIFGLLSLFIYVWVYTPLKQKTWVSLIVGSFPGAMPVVLGYFSLSPTLDQKAMAMFAWAFVWQIPHFIAISVFREKEYTNAGYPVLIKAYGINTAKIILLLTSYGLVFINFWLYRSGILSNIGLVSGLLIGIWFLSVAHNKLYKKNLTAWAKKVFTASLVYQTLLFALLIIEALIKHASR